VQNKWACHIDFQGRETSHSAPRLHVTKSKFPVSCDHEKEILMFFLLFKTKSGWKCVRFGQHVISIF
jgi:hypothetical protein